VETWRQVIITILIVLSVIDIVATYNYVSRYKKWQPNKPYELIELNPLLVFLWNTFGLHLGMFIGAIVLLALNYIVGKEAHYSIAIILLIFLIYATYNHNKNINLLFQLMDKYPTGYLPYDIFGRVIGNN